MKKYFLLVVSAVALAFTSCSDSEEIDIKYQVNVTVDPSTVKSAFHGYSVNDETYGLNMDETSKLLITSLIYDNSGNLVSEDISVSICYKLIEEAIEFIRAKENLVLTKVSSVKPNNNIPDDISIDSGVLKKILFITSTEQAALRYSTDLERLFNINADILPYQNTSPYETLIGNLYDYQKQINVLRSKNDFIIASYLI